MANKNGVQTYLLASIASICFVSGLLVLTGGEHQHDANKRNSINAR